MPDRDLSAPQSRSLDWFEEERGDLLRLARSVVAQAPQARVAFGDFVEALQLMRVDARPEIEIEAELAQRALELRRLWLSVAHRAADRTLKSPLAEQVARTPSGTVIDYGYERDLDPGALEARVETCVRVPEGWCGDHLLFSSGQAGLAAILQTVLAQRPQGERAKLRALFVGNYFETHDLFDLFGFAIDCEQVQDWGASLSPAQLAGCDVLVAEPVSYAREMRALDLERLFAAWRGDGARPSVVIFDTTLVGAQFPLARVLDAMAGAQAPLVIQLHSGLKLDQAGLELANVGVASLYRARASGEATTFADRLRKTRTVTGCGLTFDEIASLEAPWFLDPDYHARYTARVFAHNALLAHALAACRGAEIAHASLGDMAAVAPFCLVHLKSGGNAAYRALESRIAEAAGERGLLFERGGSFGFRGHRYEVVEPAPERGTPFLRIAMGARGGPSLSGIIALMQELLS